MSFHYSWTVFPSNFEPISILSTTGLWGICTAQTLSIKDFLIKCEKTYLKLENS